jgi:hypothetical protein
LQLPGPRKDRHVSSLKQSRETLEQNINNFVLSILAHRKINSNGAGAKSEVRSVFNRAIDVRRFQKFFRWYTTAVQARATYFVTLDERNVQSRGCSIERSGVTAWPPTNDDDIKLLGFFSHGTFPSRTIQPM